KPYAIIIGKARILIFISHPTSIHISPLNPRPTLLLVGAEVANQDNQEEQKLQNQAVTLCVHSSQVKPHMQNLGGLPSHHQYLPHPQPPSLLKCLIHNPHDPSDTVAASHSLPHLVNSPLRLLHLLLDLYLNPRNSPSLPPLLSTLPPSYS
ncbi:hypothetical protein ACTXT7_017317, partial [Hymenolepis weldensis]